MNIKETVVEVHNCAKEKGFWDKEPNIPGMLMLCVSELAEAMESDRKDKKADMEEYHRVINIYPSDDEHFKTTFGDYIKDSFEDELADSIIRIFDMCGGLNIDIEKHIELKMKYNSMRSHMNGGKRY